MQEVVPYRPNVVGIEQRVLEALIEGPHTVAELIESVFAGAREPDAAKQAIWNAIKKLNRRKLKDGWVIERRYVLVKR